ncbi:hypothetical protein ACFYWS_25225 [Streptomyces sp. NPDC002795]|uniref:hypothetical protein n=1 Tax=Streptomyces sp. NPDC002795 TaxID=3364665 RepID=UPI003686F92B
MTLTVLGCLLVRQTYRSPWVVESGGEQGGGHTEIGSYCAVAVLIGLCWRPADGPGRFGATEILGIDVAPMLPNLTVIALTLGGLYLLTYSSSWRTLAPWLAPVLVPVAIGLVPGAGGLVIRQYLDAFGVEPGDVGVPLYWQLKAAASWLGELGALLVVPAAFGYLRAVHITLGNRGAVTLLTVLAVLVGYAWYFNGHFLGEARGAGEHAVYVAKKGRTPAPYYGVDPACV